ncbi:MAG: hypothetical protein II537_05595 [Bacteroidales bacterium]|nr:hypothetical protein [Bacteroidales bacterium]
MTDPLSLAAGLWEIAGIGEEKRERETPRSGVKPEGRKGSGGVAARDS